MKWLPQSAQSTSKGDSGICISTPSDDHTVFGQDGLGCDAVVTYYNPQISMD